MKGSIALLGLGLAALSFSATAKEVLSYNYVQAAYLSQSAADGGPKSTGFEAGISGLIGEGLFAFGSYVDANTESFTVGTPPFGATGKIAFKQYKAGLGVHSPLAMAPAADLRITAAYLRQENKGKDGFSGFPALDVDGNGYEVGVGLRQLLLPQLEIDLLGNYDNVSNTETHHTTGIASVLFYLTPMLSIVGSYSYNSDADGWAAGARIRF